MEILYSIDKRVLKKTSELVNVKVYGKRKKIKRIRANYDTKPHPYDLRNLSLVLGINPTQQDYDQEFNRKLWEVIQSCYDNGKTDTEVIDEYLTHHYNVNPDKAKFLKHTLFLLDVFLEVLNDKQGEKVKKWLTDKMNGTGKGQDEIIQKFEDLLKPEDLKRCLVALREVENPVIDKKNNYILGKRSKGAFTALMAALKGKIKPVDEKTCARLLNNKFRGLNISDRTLRNPKTKAYNFYYQPLTALINK